MTFHHHHNKQAGYIIKGTVTITIDDEECPCTSGDAYLIPGNVKHSFTVIGSLPVDYIEVFYPPGE